MAEFTGMINHNQIILPTPLSLDKLKGKSADAHLKANITLGTTADALKAIEELKRTQDAELMHLLKEREDLVAKHEKLKSEHKINIDKSRIRAQAMGVDRGERLSDISESSGGPPANFQPLKKPIHPKLPQAAPNRYTSAVTPTHTPTPNSNP